MANKPLAWITGAGGLLGSYLVRTASQLHLPWSVRPITRATLDLTRFDEVTRLFQTERPAIVIHCAALSRSADCETNPDQARLLNVDVTRHLTQLASGIPFLFFSTDLVFDGRQGNYTESAPPNPLGVYGHTKVLAEQTVLANPRHTVLRTSLNAGQSPTGNRSFTEDMRRAWSNGQTLRLFTDEFRCPIPAAVTAQATWTLASLSVTGLFHLAGRDRLSRFAIGQLIAARCQDLHPRFEPASLRDYQGPPRPADCSLDCAKAQALLPFPLLGLRDWLQHNPEELG